MTEETASFADFARRLGCKRGYVTELRKTDRLVLTDDGKAVRVADSIARIEATRDPSKCGVAARHASARASEVANGPAVAGPPQEPAHAPTFVPEDRAGQDRITGTYQASRAVRERYLAMQAKVDYERSVGKLLNGADVESAVFASITTLRVRLESLPSVVSPRLAAETDEPKITAILAEEIEHMLAECERQFQSIAKPLPQPETP